MNRAWFPDSPRGFPGLFEDSLDSPGLVPDNGCSTGVRIKHKPNFPMAVASKWFGRTAGLRTSAGIQYESSGNSPPSPFML
jgi:hypothetical protein